MEFWIRIILFAFGLAWMIYILSAVLTAHKSSPKRFDLCSALAVIMGLALMALLQAGVPTGLEAVDGNVEAVETNPLVSLKTDSRLDGKAALSFGYLTEQDEYVVMVRKGDGGYRRKSYPADDTVVYEDADADAARVEVVDQHVVIRETHEFPIVGEWTRDRRELSKREIRMHVPKGSIVQGEYDFQ
ncbi:hypothetical protein DWX55_06530 [Collinsella sp. AF19-7AC]|uniref:hypothetical protein n=2 Tax=Collinsella TaxID=102106 RepID=UPI000E4BD50E|nr:MULTISPECIES: hypothetical protein [unclassified Collinsella]RGT03980.1 hypothetical protein DWX55_06530 [Collinsella sp. AF19-7AC]RGT30358.1 hypothetical protein DWX39_06660 [Collinsella sp. AF19-1LB]RHE27219.1 hypothetical protein DW754_06675 [Collinsella sp. AM29-10AC]